MKRSTKRALFALLPLLLFAVFQITFYTQSCASQCQCQRDDYEVCGWFCRFSADASAVFTFYGSACVLLGFVFLYDQIKQGKRSLKLTRQTLNAYINKERGRLLVVDCGLETEEERDEDGQSMSLVMLPYCTFRHMGEMPVVITGCQLDATGWNPESTQAHGLPDPVQRPKARSMYRVVEKGGTYTVSFNSIRHAPVRGYPGRNDDAVLQVCILYDTGMGEFVMRACCILSLDDEMNTDFRVHHERAYTDDQPLRPA